MVDAVNPTPAQDPHDKQPPARRVLLWLLALPGAATLLSALSRQIDFGGLVHQIVTHWRAFTHVLWGDLFAWLGTFAPFAPPTDAMKDLGTFV